MPYKAILSGSHNDVRFNIGDTVDKPKGSMDGSKSLIWVEEKGKPIDGTVKEIKDWLDDNDIEYPPTARKDQLLEILNES